MICGMGSKTGLLAKKGAAADVTPDAVNWANVTSTSSTTVTSSTQTITGINTTITLQIDFSGASSILVRSYSKNGGTFTAFSSGTTISVANNDTLAFRFNGQGPASTSNFTVKNVSDGNATLDTFSLIVSLSGG